MAVELYKWNPRRPVISARVGRKIPLRKRLNNFGDLLGPLIVTRLLADHGLSPSAATVDATLLSVGSVMHLAPPGAVVWGSGVNGKMPLTRERVRSLDVRAVRGPLTQERLRTLGVAAPAVYGDPALLVPLLWDTRSWVHPTAPRAPIYVPNFNDARTCGSLPKGVRLVRPTAKLSTVLREIAGAELVIGSSLHAIVLAEAMGVPARGVVSDVESRFKYDDYFFGTGRHQYRMADDVTQALRMGGERPLQWEAGPLLDAFPWDLWSAAPRAADAEASPGPRSSTADGA